MAECIVCKGVFEAKRADAVYCSAKCRVAANRNKAAVTDNSVTDNKEVVVTDNPLEYCRICQVKLPPLEKPRKQPGMCINCVTDKYKLKQPKVSQVAA